MASENLAAFRLMSTETLEVKEVCHWFAEPSSHFFKFCERRRISAPFDQTEKIDRHTDYFGKFFLTFVHFVTDLPDAPPELFPQASQISRCTGQKSGVI
jgi:hypothetical protein